MASQLSSRNPIANRYASALFDLCRENKIIDEVLQDFNIIQKSILENKELKIISLSPLVTSDDKLKIFEKILINQNVNVMTITFLKVIGKNKRFSNLLSIISEFKDINAKNRGDILADVTSAEVLSDEEKNKIKNQLKTMLGNKLSLNFKVDKKIIGGLIVKVGSKMIDTSLANKINKLRIVMKGA